MEDPPSDGAVQLTVADPLICTEFSIRVVITDGIVAAYTFNPAEDVEYPLKLEHAIVNV